MITLGSAALRHAAGGRAVFPLVPGDKLPLISREKGGRGCHDATLDADRIARWWKKWPDANIGMHCGPASNIWALDIDVKNDGEATLAALEAVHGKLPWTVEVATPGGGRHLYWQWDDSRPVANSASTALGPGLDTRAQGGYVVAPPSVIGDRAYRVTSERGTPIEHAPDWLYELLAKAKAPAGQRKTTGAWAELIGGDIGDGRRNDTLTKVCGHLMRGYIDPVVVLQCVEALNMVKCKPPLPAHEVERIFNSVGATEKKRRDKLSRSRK